MPPFEDDDPPELRIKKYEHLYVLGKEALADEVRRLERVESKVHRLLYLLTIVDLTGVDIELCPRCKLGELVHLPLSWPERGRPPPIAAGAR